MHRRPASPTGTSATTADDETGRRGGAAAMPARTRCCARRRPPARARSLDRYAARLSARARTTSRRACARPSARCASACACGAPRRSCRGSACCVYGLTFTSHFYGARRTVGYVPFNSEIARHRQAVRGHPRSGARAGRSRAVRRRSSSPISACRPPRACRCSCCRRRSTACASSASTCRASACRPMPKPRTCWPARCCNYARARSRAGSGAGAARRAAAERPTVTLLGEMFPADPVGIGTHAGADGPGRRSGRADARMARALRRARLRRGRRDPSLLHRLLPRVRGGGPPDRRLGAGRPRRHRRLARGDRRGLRRRREQDRRGEERRAARHRGGARRACRSRAASRCRATKARSCWSRACSIESGADVRYVGTACPRTQLVGADRDWLEARGVRCAVPRLARAGPRGVARIRARPRHRHHAGGAEGQGAGDPGALLHQPHLGAAADGPRRRRLARAGRQRGARPTRRASTR